MKISYLIEKIYAKKNLILTILPSVVIIGIYSIFSPSWRDRKYKTEINELKAQNDRLKKANDSIFTSIENMKIDMERSDEIIIALHQESELYHDKADSLSKSIKNIQNKYEKASNHANSFTSREIVGYFSNL